MGVLRPCMNKLWASGFWFPGGRGDFLQVSMGHCGAGEHRKWVKPLWPGLGTSCPMLGRAPGPRKGHTTGAEWQEDHCPGHKESLGLVFLGCGETGVTCFSESARDRTGLCGKRQGQEPHCQKVEYRPLQSANVPACTARPCAPPPTPQGTARGKVLQVSCPVLLISTVWPLL